jgi:hypothetical protein
MMASLGHLLITRREPMGIFPATLRAPVLGLIWVLLNIVLGWSASTTNHPAFGFLTAGAMDGTILSVIVVARASHQFRSGATGLLGGLGLDALTNNGQTLVTKTANAIHEITDTLVVSISGPGNEPQHRALEAEIVLAIWVAIIVVLAALIVKWVQMPGRQGTSNWSKSSRRHQAAI